MSSPRLRVADLGHGWVLAGPAAGDFAVVNDFLDYVSDRNFSPLTRRAYAFDLLAFARWLDAGESSWLT